MFAYTIKNLLITKKLSQKDLALYIGVTASTVNNWLNKNRSPKIEHIYLIAEFFNVSMSFLFTGKDDVYNDDDDIKKELEAKETPLSIDEETLLDTYRSIPKSGKLELQYASKEIWAKYSTLSHMKKTSSNFQTFEDSGNIINSNKNTLFADLKKSNNTHYDN